MFLVHHDPNRTLNPIENLIQILELGAFKNHHFSEIRWKKRCFGGGNRSNEATLTSDNKKLT